VDDGFGMGGHGSAGFGAAGEFSLSDGRAQVRYRTRGASLDTSETNPAVQTADSAVIEQHQSSG